MKILRLIVFMLMDLAAEAQVKTIYLYSFPGKVPVPGAIAIRQDRLPVQVSNGIGALRIDPAASPSYTIYTLGYDSLVVDARQIADRSIIYLAEKVTSLREVVVSTPSSIGVLNTISNLDIHIRPIVTSQDVLRIVPGLFIGQHAGGGKAEQLFLRGFDIDHGTDFGITVDGMPVNMVSHAHGQGYADLHFVIPELIEKVDFDKGPYFADKGNFVTAGFADFKLKNYLERNFVKAEGGQFNTWRAVAAVNLLKKETTVKTNNSLYASTEYSHTKGYFESPQHFNRFNGILKYHGKISEISSLSAYVSGFTSSWNASGQIPDRAVKQGLIGWYGAIDNTEGGNTSRYNASVALNTTFDNGLQWNNLIYYSHYRFKLFSNFTFFLNNPVDGDQIRQSEQRNLAGFQSDILHNNKIGGVQGAFKVGVQVRADMTKDSELSNTKNRTELLRRIMLGDIREVSAGVYVEQLFRFSSVLELAVGARGDIFLNSYHDKLISQNLSAQSHTVSPKLRLNYKANDKVQLYGYLGRGFHTNDTRVAVQRNGREVVTPAVGGDLGGIFKIGNKVLLQTAIWYLWLQQEFVYVGDEGVVEPGGKTRRYGSDLSVRYEILRSLYADVDLNVSMPRAVGVPKKEHYLPLAPVVTSTGGLHYVNSSGWNGSIRYRFMGKRPANEDYSITAKGYFIGDAGLSYNKQNWEAGVSVQNIFNTKWKETQFDTETRLKDEPDPVSEIHFTPGTPFFARLSFTVFF
jgi:hypothetical protein